MSMRWFQGQLRGSRRRLRRPLRMMRPATPSSRKRSLLGSQRLAGWSCQARVWVQTRRSAARAMISSQIWFWAKLWKVPQAGVLQPPDAVLGAGALAVPDLQCSQGPAGSLGVGGEAGDPPAVLVGEAQLRSGVGTFAASDHPHPWRPAGQGVGEISGELGYLGAVTGLPVAVDRRAPRLRRTFPSASTTGGIP